MIKHSFTVLVVAAALAVAGLPAVAQQDPQQPPSQFQQPQAAPQEMQPQQDGQQPERVGPGSQQEAEEQGGPGPGAQQGAPDGQQPGGPPSYAQQQGAAPDGQQQGGPPSYAQQGAPSQGAPGTKRHGRNKLRAALRSMDLSEDQQSQIKAFMQQYRTSRQGGGTPETRRQLMANIESSLTPDQRSQFEDAMRGPRQAQPTQGPAPQ